MNKYLQQYLEYLEEELNYSLKTIENYEIDITFFQQYLEEHHLNYLKLTKNDIRGYLKYLDDLKYKNSSISRRLSSIRSFYSYLVQEGILKENIIKRISNPKKEKKLPNFLNYEEI